MDDHAATYAAESMQPHELARVEPESPSFRAGRCQDLPEGWGFLTITDGRLRVKKSAPVLTPEPITHSFLAALSRALIRTNGGTQ